MVDTVPTPAAVVTAVLVGVAATAVSVAVPSAPVLVKAADDNQRVQFSNSLVAAWE